MNEQSKGLINECLMTNVRFYAEKMHYYETSESPHRDEIYKAFKHWYDAYFQAFAEFNGIDLGEDDGCICTKEH